MDEVPIKIRTDSVEILQQFFGSKQPTTDQSVDVVPGATLIHKSHIIRHGIVDSSVLITVLIQIGTGVATELLANWIAVRLAGRKVTIDIDGQRLTEANGLEIEKSIDAVRAKR